LGVGVTASGGAGSIRATGDITAFFSSDSRFKENIVPITNSIEKVKALSGITFEWTDEYMSSHGGEDRYFMRKKDVGIIAQELQKVLPELVAERPDGTLAVKYDRISALLIEAIKDLSEIVEKKE
jgi:hypothetical protein